MPPVNRVAGSTLERPGFTPWTFRYNLYENEMPDNAHSAEVALQTVDRNGEVQVFQKSAIFSAGTTENKFRNTLWLTVMIPDELADCRVIGLTTKFFDRKHRVVASTDKLFSKENPLQIEMGDPTIVLCDDFTRFTFKKSAQRAMVEDETNITDEFSNSGNPRVVKFDGLPTKMQRDAASVLNKKVITSDDIKYEIYEQVVDIARASVAQVLANPLSLSSLITTFKTESVTGKAGWISRIAPNGSKTYDDLISTISRATGLQRLHGKVKAHSILEGSMPSVLALAFLSEMALAGDASIRAEIGTDISTIRNNLVEAIELAARTLINYGNTTNKTELIIPAERGIGLTG